MDQPSTAPTLKLEVMISSVGTPVLWLEAGSKRIPLQLTSEQATATGLALLSVGFLCTSGGPQGPKDQKIESCPLPVVGFRAGLSENSNWCSLQVKLAGGGELMLGFPPDGTRECAKALEAASSQLQDRSSTNFIVANTPV
jgi:hypothetical protein